MKLIITTLVLIEEIQEYFEYVHLESQEIKFTQTTTAIKDI